jgi:hypothetical protein
MIEKVPDVRKMRTFMKTTVGVAVYQNVPERLTDHYSALISSKEPVTPEVLEASLLKEWAFIATHLDGIQGQL